MQDLAQLECLACRAGEPQIREDEIAEFAPQLPEWHIVERDNMKQLERVFKFKNFAQALAFTNNVG